MFENLKARFKTIMEDVAKTEMILKDGTQVEFKDGELTLVSTKGDSITLDSYAESEAEPASDEFTNYASPSDEIAALEKRIQFLRAESGENTHVWTKGELPGAVKIRTCAGDANHVPHWEKV